MKFAAIIEYTPDKAKIGDLRPAHREYLAALRKAGKCAMGGPFHDDSGALIVYEADTKEEVEKLMQADPFGTGGVFVSWSIRPWKLLWIQQDLMPV